MAVEQRAEELKNGANEGTEAVKGDRDMESINYGRRSMSAGGRSGETRSGPKAMDSRHCFREPSERERCTRT